MKIPMRHKYVDEAIGIYMVFGTHKDGTVDVSDGGRDVFIALPEEVAVRVVELHDEFRQKMYQLLCTPL